MRPALLTTIAYLLGSIPFGYLIVRTTQGADIRETGSGGTGATNVSRQAGKSAGTLTLILDALKGAVAVLVAKTLLGLPIATESLGPLQQANYWWVTVAAVAVIVGHMFPVWLRFRGGKGVATGVGVFLALAPLAVALAAILFVLIVWKTRYVSLGSMAAAMAIPVFVLAQNAFIRPVSPLAPVVSASTIGAALIIFAHRGNIGRLIEGSESKFK
ncbi:MAG TPA: glycerol-3-phosphate 1-O-acyltransferase PlsY [Pyrinomonadaceae bacterium]|nr:glycerol-3-phosphate 1-O-acyltransferase PlsY [Pyrinomonadaceae bacterium]